MGMLTQTGQDFIALFTACLNSNESLYSYRKPKLDACCHAILMIPLFSFHSKVRHNPLMFKCKSASCLSCIAPQMGPRTARPPLAGSNCYNEGLTGGAALINKVFISHFPR